VSVALTRKPAAEAAAMAGVLTARDRQRTGQPRNRTAELACPVAATFRLWQFVPAGQTRSGPLSSNNSPVGDGSGSV
jgi:hypothetical protein